MSKRLKQTERKSFRFTKLETHFLKLLCDQSGLNETTMLRWLIRQEAKKLNLSVLK